jgi:hypothetical protein
LADVALPAKAKDPARLVEGDALGDLEHVHIEGRARSVGCARTRTGSSIIGVKGLGYRIQGSGFWVQGQGFWV